MTKKIGYLLLSLFLYSCAYNEIELAEESTKSAWAEVQNQHQRRSDLIPGLVAVVKGYAAHEKDTLQAVIEARAKASSVQIDPSKLNAETLAKFQEAQTGLTQALGKLMVVIEKYPELKANENFLALQSQLEGTENRITIARRRYIESINHFNSLIRVFPNNLTNKFLNQLEAKPQFTIAPEKMEAPKIEF